MEPKKQETLYHSEKITNAKELIEALQKVPQNKPIIFSIMDGSDVVWVTNDPTSIFVMVCG